MPRAPRWGSTTGRVMRNGNESRCPAGSLLRNTETGPAVRDSWVSLDILCDVIDVWDPRRFSHPWFAPVADLVARLAHHRDWPTIAELNECFAAELGHVGVRLVASHKPKRSRSRSRTK